MTSRTDFVRFALAFFSLNRKPRGGAAALKNAYMATRRSPWQFILQAHSVPPSVRGIEACCSECGQQHRMAVSHYRLVRLF